MNKKIVYLIIALAMIVPAVILFSGRPAEETGLIFWAARSPASFWLSIAILTGRFAGRITR